MKSKRLFLLIQLMVVFGCLSIDVYGQDPFLVPWTQFTGDESMTVVTRIKIDDVVQETTQLVIGAFKVGTDECRGYNFLQDFTSYDLGFLVFLTVGSSSFTDPGRNFDLYYKVYDNRTGIEFPITIPGAESYIPGDNGEVGNYLDPVVSTAIIPQSDIALGSFTNGSVTVSGATSDVKAGTTVTLTVTPDAGYELASIKAEKDGDALTSVTPTGSGTSYSFTMPAYNVTIQATFDPSAVTVAKTLLTWDIIRNSNTAATDVTTNLALPSTIGSDGVNISWASDNTAVDATTGAVTRPPYDGNDATVTLTATLTKGPDSDTKTFTLTVKKIPAYGVSVGSFTGGSVSADKTSVPAGENVTLTITPDRGYELESLTIAGSDVTASVSNNEYQFAMPPTDVTVTATFKENADQLAVKTAKSLIEGGTYTIDEVTANTADDVKTSLAATINALSGIPAGLTVTAADITLSGFTPAEDGVNGSFTFTVALELPNSTQVTTNVKGGVITATPIVNAADPVISGQPQHVTVSENATATLTVTAASTDGGTLSYQWYSNTTNSNSGGTEITGANAASYTTPTLTGVGDYYYYVTVTNTASVNGTPTATTTSSVATVTVNALVNAEAPVITTQPVDATYDENESPTDLTVVTASVTDGGTLSYQWYGNTANSNTGGTAITGANSDQYTPSTAAAGTTYYYVVVTNTIADNSDGGQKAVSAVSAVATITVNAIVNADVPVISNQPQGATVTQNDVFTLSVVASVTDGGTLSYQWYSNTTNSNSGGTPIGSATGSSYVPPTTASGDVYYYVEVTNTNNSVNGTPTAMATSAPATVTVNVQTNAAIPSITVQSPDITVNEGAPVTLTVTASVTDGGVLSYEWFGNTSNSNTGGTLITSATGASYTPSTATAGTLYYYVVVTNTNSSVNGVPTATLAGVPIAVTINAIVDAPSPVISGQPQSGASYTVGLPATDLSVTATGSGILSYQWYSNTTNSNTGGTAITGATGANYTPSTATVGTLYYYVVVTNTDVTVNGTPIVTTVSNTAAVTVNALVNAQMPTISVQPQDVSYTVGQTAAALSVTANVGDGGTLSYQWYNNTTNSNTGGTVITGATGVSYTPSTATVGTAYYYVVVTNTNSGVTGTPTATTASNAAAVTVNALVNAQTPTISVQPQDVGYTIGQTAADLNVTANVGDGGTLSYQWYWNTANSNTGGTAITGATGASYTPSIAAVGIVYYYVVVTNTNSSVNGTPTATVTSRAAKITVTDATPPPPPPVFYTVTVPLLTNGAITASYASATAGTTIMLTLTPAAGYEPDVITVYRAGNAAVTVNVSGSGNTRTFTMPGYNVIVSATFKKTQAQLDREAVDVAKAAIEGGTYRIAQATGNTEAGIRTWLINTLRVLFGQSSGVQIRSAADPIVVDVTITALIPAIEGTEAIPSGTNGSFRFTATMTKGATTHTTGEISGVIIATPHATTPLKQIELLPLGGTTVRILNTGNVATGDLTLTLTGAHAESFTFSPSSPGSLSAGNETDIVLTHNAGLATGTYTLTLTVDADGLTPVSASITYTVMPTGTESLPTAPQLKAWTQGVTLHVSGLTVGQPWSVYAISGALVHYSTATGSEAEITLPIRGVYIVKSGDTALKVAY
jgi:hypothetical protein